MVLEAAEGMVWNRRIAAQLGVDGEYLGGFGIVEDPTFVLRTVQVLLFSAMHISVLPTLTSRNLESVEGEVFLTWRRPKTERWASVRVPEEVRPWIASYLDLPKPMTPDAYRDVLDKLAVRVEVMFGVIMHLSPLRFRHGGITEAKNELNLTDREAAIVAASTLKTVQEYASLMDNLLLARKMKDAGQDQMFARMKEKRRKYRPESRSRSPQYPSPRSRDPAPELTS